MIPNPKIEGVDPKYLFEYEGEHGEFYIGPIGGMLERTFGFYYRDEKYELCFYADRVWDGKNYDVLIEDATMLKFHGASPRVEPRDYDGIAHNMTRFFSERFFLSPRRPIPATEEFRSLRLVWKLK